MTFTFKFTSTDSATFEKCYLGFIIGGNMLHPNGQARSRDERGHEAAFIKQAKAISVDTSTNPAEISRTLRPDGGTITLNAKQFELAKKYLEAAPFPTQDSDVVDDLLDWVSTTQADAEK